MIQAVGFDAMSNGHLFPSDIWLKKGILCLWIKAFSFHLEKSSKCLAHPLSKFRHLSNATN